MKNFSAFQIELKYMYMIIFILKYLKRILYLLLTRYFDFFMKNREAHEHAVDDLAESGPFAQTVTPYEFALAFPHNLPLLFSHLIFLIF